MSLIIKKAHLKYTLTLMATPLDYPQFFYEDAEIFVHFFRRLDDKTTNRMRKRTKDGKVPRAYFGQMIIDLSKLNFLAVANASPKEKQAMGKISRNTFLNLAAWYICPLIEANRRVCPYMTFGWVKNFLTTANERSPTERQAYYDSIRAFINSAQSRNWGGALKDIATQLGKDAETYILLLMGMFLAAHEEQKGQIALPPANSEETNAPKQPLSDLDPEIVKFLNSIKAISELDDPSSA